jgi:hypothetical protein
VNNIDALIESALQDFPDEKPTSELYQGIQAAADEIARRSITDKTRAGHLRCAFFNSTVSLCIATSFLHNFCSIVRAFVLYMLMLNAKWCPKVTVQSPLDVQAFITKKCGAADKGYEGKKVFQCITLLEAFPEVILAVCNCCFN